MGSEDDCFTIELPFGTLCLFFFALPLRAPADGPVPVVHVGLTTARAPFSRSYQCTLFFLRRAFAARAAVRRSFPFRRGMRNPCQFPGVEVKAVHVPRI